MTPEENNIFFEMVVDSLGFESSIYQLVQPRK